MNTLTLPPKYAGRAALSPSEAAEVLGVDPSTFYRRVMPFVRSGDILSLKIGANRRIVVASLFAWLERTALATV